MAENKTIEINPKENSGSIREEILKKTKQELGAFYDDLFAKHVFNDIGSDLDKDTAPSYALSQKQEILEKSSSIKNASTLFMETVINPSLRQFATDTISQPAGSPDTRTIDALDPKDIDFYRALFFNENNPGPILSSIKTYINSVFEEKNGILTPKNPKFSFSLFTKGIDGKGIFMQVNTFISLATTILANPSLDQESRVRLQNLVASLSPIATLVAAKTLDPQLVKRVRDLHPTDGSHNSTPVPPQNPVVSSPSNDIPQTPEDRSNDENYTNQLAQTPTDIAAPLNDYTANEDSALVLHATTLNDSLDSNRPSSLTPEQEAVINGTPGATPGESISAVELPSDATVSNFPTSLESSATSTDRVLDELRGTSERLKETLGEQKFNELFVYRNGILEFKTYRLTRYLSDKVNHNATQEPFTVAEYDAMKEAMSSFHTHSRLTIESFFVTEKVEEAKLSSYILPYLQTNLGLNFVVENRGRNIYQTRLVTNRYVSTIPAAPRDVQTSRVITTPSPENAAVSSVDAGAPFKATINLGSPQPGSSAEIKATTPSPDFSIPGITTPENIDHTALDSAA